MDLWIHSPHFIPTWPCRAGPSRGLHRVSAAVQEHDLRPPPHRRIAERERGGEGGGKKYGEKGRPLLLDKPLHPFFAVARDACRCWDRVRSGIRSSSGATTSPAGSTGEAEQERLPESDFLGYVFCSMSRDCMRPSCLGQRPCLLT